MLLAPYKQSQLLPKPGRGHISSLTSPLPPHVIFESCFSFRYGFWRGASPPLEAHDHQRLTCPTCATTNASHVPPAPHKSRLRRHHRLTRPTHSTTTTTSHIPPAPAPTPHTSRHQHLTCPTCAATSASHIPPAPSHTSHHQHPTSPTCATTNASHVPPTPPPMPHTSCSWHHRLTHPARTCTNTSRPVHAATNASYVLPAPMPHNSRHLHLRPPVRAATNASHLQPVPPLRLTSCTAVAPIALTPLLPGQQQSSAHTFLQPFSHSRFCRHPAWEEGGRRSSLGGRHASLLPHAPSPAAQDAIGTGSRAMPRYLSTLVSPFSFPVHLSSTRVRSKM